MTNVKPAFSVSGSTGGQVDMDHIPFRGGRLIGKLRSFVGAHIIHSPFSQLNPWRQPVRPLPEVRSAQFPCPKRPVLLLPRQLPARLPLSGTRSRFFYLQYTAGDENRLCLHYAKGIIFGEKKKSPAGFRRRGSQNSVDHAVLAAFAASRLALISARSFCSAAQSFSALSFHSAA